MIDEYSDFLPSMKPLLASCPDNFIEQALWLSGRDFAKETESYIQELTAIDSVADQLEYTITVPTQFDFLRVFEVRTRTEDEVTDGTDGTVVDPSKYDWVLPNTLKFFTAPFSEAITGGLVVELCLAPQEDEDDSVLDFSWVRRYSEYIKAGALYNLFAQPKRDWTSGTEATRFFAEYRKGIAYAKREVYNKYTTRQLKMVGNGFMV